MQKDKAVRQKKFKWLVENRWNELPAEQREKIERLLGQLIAAVAQEDKSLPKENDDE